MMVSIIPPSAAEPDPKRLASARVPRKEFGHKFMRRRLAWKSNSGESALWSGDECQKTTLVLGTLLSWL